MLLLRNRVVDFVEICNVCAKKVIIKAAKRIINSGKMCRSYSDLNFGVTFLEHSVYIRYSVKLTRLHVLIHYLAYSIYSIISLNKSCYPECERPTSLRHPARGDNLKNYPAPAYNKVGQPWPILSLYRRNKIDFYKIFDRSVPVMLRPATVRKICQDG